MNTKLFHKLERQDAPPVTATKRKPKPITANPLFPLVTALWFATLLGLGSFATAPALLEGPVVALGIPAWIPAAAPPLGFTTRAIFAVAMLGLGAVFGYNLGKFLGRDKTASPVRARGPGKKDSAAASAQAWRPINANEDLGAPLDAPVTDAAAPRRRALTQSDEAPVAATPAFIASPTDHAPVFKERQEFQPSAADNTAPPSDKVADPLGLDLFLEEASATEPAPFTTSPPAFAAPQETPEHEAAIAQFEPDDAEFADEPESEGYGTSFEPIMEAVATAEPHSAEPEPVQPTRLQQALAQPALAQPMPFLQARAVDALPIDRAPLDNLGLVQLVERLALAISRRAAPAERFEPVQPKLSELKMAEPVIAEPVIAEPVMAEPMMPETSLVEPDAPEFNAPEFTAPAFTAPAPSAPDYVVSAPMAPPAMARFEKAPSAAPLTELPDEDADSAFGTASFIQDDAFSTEADAPEQAERIVHLRPSTLQPLPSFADLALDPQAPDDEPEPEHDAGLERFLRMSPLLARKSDQIAEAFGVTSDTAPEPEVVEDCYPSLLDMAPVVPRREPLRIEDSAFEDDVIIEPAVVFPGQEAPWSAQAARVAPTPSAAITAAPPSLAPSRPFERPSVIPVPGSPLASPGRAAPSAQVPVAYEPDNAGQALGMPDAEEADRALRAALATLQRMTARG